MADQLLPTPALPRRVAAPLATPGDGLGGSPLGSVKPTDATGLSTGRPRTGRCCLAALVLGLVSGCEHGIGPQLPGSPAPARGGLDPSFGVGGVVTSDPSAGVDEVTAQSGDGFYMFVIGSAETPGPGDKAWRIEKRLLTTGALDSGFGISGAVTSNPSSGTDAPTAVTQAGTFLYVAGFDSVLGDRRWRIEKRRMLDGTLDTGFGVSGVLATNPSTRRDEVVALVASAASFYVIGFDESPGIGDRQWRVEQRNFSDGALVATFGTAGILVSNPSTGIDSPFVAVSDGAVLYVGGSDSIPGDLQWRIEARRLTNGSYDTGFGTGGALVANPSSGSDEVTALALSSTALLTAGSDESPGPGNSRWRIEKRSQTSGALATAFGSGGVLTMNYSSGVDSPLRLVSGTGFFYVIGFDQSPGPLVSDSQWRIEARNPTTGALEPNYGQGGVITSNPTVADDRPSTAATAIYMVGTQNAPGNSAWRIEVRAP